MVADSVKAVGTVRQMTLPPQHASTASHASPLPWRQTLLQCSAPGVAGDWDAVSICSIRAVSDVVAQWAVDAQIGFDSRLLIDTCVV